MSELLDLPEHINTLEDKYKASLEKLKSYKVRNRYYYDHFKRTQDIKKQINVNKIIASYYGVNYGLQNKAMGASI